MDIYTRFYPIKYKNIETYNSVVLYTLYDMRMSSTLGFDACFSQFVVHLGVARGSSVIILEQTGKNSGYRDKDVCGLCPESHCCMEGGPEKLDSVINMRTVSKESKQVGVDVLYSRDAGR